MPRAEAAASELLMSRRGFGKALGVVPTASPIRRSTRAWCLRWR